MKAKKEWKMLFSCKLFSHSRRLFENKLKIENQFEASLSLLKRTVQFAVNYVQKKLQLESQKLSSKSFFFIKCFEIFRLLFELKSKNFLTLTSGPRGC